MKTPTVTVGILSSTRPIHVNLSGIFSGDGDAVVTGQIDFALSEGGCRVVMSGREKDAVELYPTSPEGDSFEIEGVTIGVDFHWERKENQRFRGGLKVVADGGRLSLINIVDVEEYLKSVISSEMAATASSNLLKAHAVISRSWLIAQMQRKQRNFRRTAPSDMIDTPEEIVRWWDHEDHTLFDVCADDHCQRYQGISRIVSEKAADAVEATRGEVLKAEGELCDARFSKCCGGVFERFENCWEHSPKSYLAARRDGVDPTDFPNLSIEENAAEWILGNPSAFCNTRDEKVLAQVLNNYDRETPDFYRWEVRYTPGELGKIVASRLGSDLGDITDLRPLARGTSGRIFRLEIVGTLGSRIIGKELMIRRTLSHSHLLSSAFVVERPDGDFLLRGAGWGHGVGLCQIGAAVMGERGYSYNEILKHYYPGGQIERLY